MEASSPITAAAEGFGIELQVRDPLALKKMLTEKIAYLLQHDFDKLISLLYRMDVDEALLRQKIGENDGEDTALIITELVIDRQVKRLDTRRQFPKNDEGIDENEKW